MERIREAIEFWQEIAVVEIGPAVEDDDGCTLSDFSGIQLRTSDRDKAFTRRGTLFAFQPRRRTGRQPCCVCARKDRKDQGRFHGIEGYNTVLPYGKPFSQSGLRPYYGQT